MNPYLGGRTRLNLFGIPFGLAGLAGLWTETAQFVHLPDAVPDAFWVIAIIAWLVVAGRYMVSASSFRAVLSDVRDAALGPFAALAIVVATLIGERVYAEARVVGEVWVLSTSTASLLFGAWFIAELATGEREIDQLHSGYFLPTVAAGLLSAQALAATGFHLLAMAAFGTGILSWMLIGSVTLHRLAFRPQPPASLIPTYAIFSAPPAVAGNAWFEITAASGTERLDAFQEVLLGTFLLLIAFQLLLIPTYLKVPFSLGFWALTFTTTASGRYAIRVVADVDVPYGEVAEWLIALAATGLVAVIAVASVHMTIRGRSRVTAGSALHSSKERP
ncbi:hypothetical protein GCM10022288_21010 [Gryllotalpicola kribbensis]|uniref:C4-dicarboxylate transporter n=1 Tax=Gryllotalpicola kribbensis TaxID=993084 RepID=A0ABP8AVA0_9MICO